MVRKRRIQLRAGLCRTERLRLVSVSEASRPAGGDSRAANGRNALLNYNVAPRGCRLSREKRSTVPRAVDARHRETINLRRPDPRDATVDPRRYSTSLRANTGPARRTERAPVAAN